MTAICDDFDSIRAKLAEMDKARAMARRAKVPFDPESDMDCVEGIVQGGMYGAAATSAIDPDEELQFLDFLLDDDYI